MSTYTYVCKIRHDLVLLLKYCNYVYCQNNLMPRIDRSIHVNDGELPEINRDKHYCNSR